MFQTLLKNFIWSNFCDKISINIVPKVFLGMFGTEHFLKFTYKSGVVGVDIRSKHWVIFKCEFIKQHNRERRKDSPSSLVTLMIFTIMLNRSSGSDLQERF